jgi:hypothetical protein
MFVSYNDLQEGFEGLWNTWLGVGRGIWDSSAVWLGVCGGPGGLGEPKLALSSPTGVQLAPTSPKLVED